jgi:AGZA family xanthine/uracil permease-like MFS transporter
VSGLLERWFRLKDNGSTIRTELLGGTTTFAAMAYIIVVNPAILSADGQPIGPLTVATILAAVFGSLLMGLYANRPLAVAPYMGENAFIATLALLYHITWQQRLGTVFVAGAVFLVITVLHLRTWLANSISVSLKHSFAVGIGLFLAFVGLINSGIVQKSTAPGPVPVEFVNFHDPKMPVDTKIHVLIAIGGFTVIAVMMCLRIRGAILLGIVATGVAAYALGVGEAPPGIVEVPFTGELSLEPIAGQCDILGVLRLSFLPVLLTLILVSFLDTLGTLVGVGAAGNMLDKEGNFPEIEKPMMVDALSCMFSAAIGTSTSGAFIESATGVREGARTGLAAVTVAVLFAVALFFIPLVQPLQKLGFVYGPALIAVGVLMLGSVTKIDFDDLTEAIPAFVTIVMMVFTYNIANGLTAGLVLYPLIKLASGRWRELNLGAALLGGISLIYYVFGMPH